jgi:hypothetical protein
MSDVENEGMSERELAQELQEKLFSGEPRSVGEALAAADEENRKPAEEAPEEEQGPEVVDEYVQPEPPAPEEQPEVPQAPGEEEAVEELEEEDDENVVWAKKKYGDDPSKWAQAARAQEQHISRIAGEKKEAEELAAQWYEYAQSIEQQTQQQQQMGMPLSSQEEMWIEQAVSNPYGYARQAALQGNVPLYQAVLTRLAEDNPGLAAQVGAQVQIEMQQMAQAEQNGVPQQTLAESLGESIQRLGIDLQVYGEPMSAKVGDLGEYHPYVQAIMEGDPRERDLALMAVYDLVRTGSLTTRKVRSAEREEQIKQEAELRRQAAGVVTGGPTPGPKPEQSPFLAAMEQEWKDRRQWAEEE